MLSKKIINVIKEKQLNSEVIAELLEVNVDTVKKWINGEQNPNNDEIEKLSKLFEIEISDVLDKDMQLNSSKGSKHTSSLKKTIILCSCIILFIVSFFVVKEQFFTTDVKSPFSLTTKNDNKVEEKSEKEAIIDGDSKNENISVGIYINKNSEDEVSKNGGVRLEIFDFSDKVIVFTFDVIQGAPNNRIAKIDGMQAHKDNSGKYSFTFFEDGWGNSGEGYLEVLDNGVINVVTEVSGSNDEALWSLGSNETKVSKVN